jgi:hypothetical protein
MMTTFLMGFGGGDELLLPHPPRPTMRIARLGITARIQKREERLIVKTS